MIPMSLLILRRGQRLRLIRERLPNLGAPFLRLRNALRLIDVHVSILSWEPHAYLSSLDIIIPCLHVSVSIPFFLFDPYILFPAFWCQVEIMTAVFCIICWPPLHIPESLAADRLATTAVMDILLPVSSFSSYPIVFFSPDLAAEIHIT